MSAATDWIVCGTNQRPDGLKIRPTFGQRSFFFRPPRSSDPPPESLPRDAAELPDDERLLRELEPDDSEFDFPRELPRLVACDSAGARLENDRSAERGAGLDRTGAAALDRFDRTPALDGRLPPLEPPVPKDVLFPPPAALPPRRGSIRGGLSSLFPLPLPLAPLPLAPPLLAPPLLAPSPPRREEPLPPPEFDDPPGFDDPPRGWRSTLPPGLLF